MDSKITLFKLIWKRKPELLLTVCNCWCSFPTPPNPSQPPRFQSSPNPNPSQLPRPSQNHLPPLSEESIELNTHKRWNWARHMSFLMWLSLRLVCRKNYPTFFCIIWPISYYLSNIILFVQYHIICPISRHFLIPLKSKSLKNGSLTQLSPRLTN